MAALCYLCGQPAEPILSSNGIKVCKWCVRVNSLAIPEGGIVQVAVDDAPTGNIGKIASVAAPVDAADWRSEWTRFYKEVFYLTVNFSHLWIPPNPGGYDWAIFNLKLKWPPIVTPNSLWAECRKRFPCFSSFGDDMSGIVPEHERTTKACSYVIRVRPCVEADEELKNVSADQIKNMQLTTMTLPERLLLELWYFWKTDRHLDIRTATLCAGSRRSGGGVPRVFWHDGRLCVFRYSSVRASDYLRARAVVS